MPRPSGGHRGSTTIEFALVGVPIIFVLISIFEISRGMWVYHTLAYSLKEATRTAIVHGHDCAVLPNSCYVSIRTLANRIAESGVGLNATELANVTFRSATRTITCPTLKACRDAGALGDTFWPALPPTDPGYPDVGAQRWSDLEITAQFPFQSAISMLWPGAGGMVFGTFTFSASSQEMIQY